MSFGADLYSFVNTYIPELEGRIYPQKPETGSDVNPSLPMGVYRIQDTSDVQDNKENREMVEYLVQLDLYHNDYDELAAFDVALQNAMWQFNDNSFASLTVIYARDAYESNTHRRILGLRVLHKNTP